MKRDSRTLSVANKSFMLTRYFSSYEPSGVQEDYDTIH